MRFHFIASLFELSRNDKRVITKDDVEPLRPLVGVFREDVPRVEVELRLTILRPSQRQLPDLVGAYVVKRLELDAPRQRLISFLQFIIEQRDSRLRLMGARVGATDQLHFPQLEE